MTLTASLADVLPAEALSDPAAVAAAPPLGRSPEAVVHPESTEEVAATLEWASAHGIGVLPVASGRRVRRRSLDRPFLLLRTDRLAGIEIYEPADLTLTARAGTSMVELADRLAAHEQWLPFDPPHVSERSLGGLVARGESGPVWTGYGGLRNHVLGMTVVTGDGRTLRLGGRVVKNVAGFDLLKPVVGSGGSLAVITSVCVRAFPRPADDRLLVLRGPSARALCDAARAVATAPVLPVSLVVQAPARALGAPAALLVRLHGARPTVDADQRTLERHCGVSFERVSDPVVALEARDGADGPDACNVSVLPSRLGEALSAVERAWTDSGASGAVVADAYLGQARVTGVTDDAAGKLRAAVERLGGSLTGSGPLEGASTAIESEIVGGLERVFDPSGALWPCRR
jgi:FAD/FMN-containing dehydrogenase